MFDGYLPFAPIGLDTISTGPERSPPQSDREYWIVKSMSSVRIAFIACIKLAYTKHCILAGVHMHVQLKKIDLKN